MQLDLLTPDTQLSLLDRLRARVQSLTTADVMGVYSGRPGCMCGCKGKHSVNPTHRAEADANRGYPHSDDEMNPAMVTRVLRLLQADDRAQLERGVVYVPRRLQREGERVYVAYLTKAVR